MTPGAGLYREYDPCPGFRAAPSKEDIDHWNKLVKPAYTPKPRTQDEKAIDRFMHTPLGRDLISKLNDAFEKAKATVSIQLDFRDKLPASTAGDIQPQTPVNWADGNTMTYHVRVLRESDRKDGDDLTYFPGPNPTTKGFAFRHRDGISRMASTIYHEILHARFLNQNEFNESDTDEGADPGLNEGWSLGGPPPDDPKPVVNPYGHGRGDEDRDVTSYDDEFLENFKDYAHQLDALEDCNKRQNAAAAAPPQTPGAPAPSGAETPR